TRYPHRTMVLRVNPGDVNLRRLCEVDAIAERVVRGELNIDRGLAELRAVRSSLSVRAVWLQVLSFGIAGGTVAALIHATWVDVIAAATIRLLAASARSSPNDSPILRRRSRPWLRLHRDTCRVVHRVQYHVPLNMRSVSDLRR
ncbi:MAG: threonine/serine exporter family protein, partial [Rhodanobacteraceae bacterium]|nr:threonine/serine exporter family protein [Rhodanobacteraceae bacterium]